MRVVEGAERGAQLRERAARQLVQADIGNLVPPAMQRQFVEHVVELPAERHGSVRRDDADIGFTPGQRPAAHRAAVEIGLRRHEDERLDSAAEILDRANPEQVRRLDAGHRPHERLAARIAHVRDAVVDDAEQRHRTLRVRVARHRRQRDGHCLHSHGYCLQSIDDRRAGRMRIFHVPVVIFIRKTI